MDSRPRSLPWLGAALLLLAVGCQRTGSDGVGIDAARVDTVPAEAVERALALDPGAPLSVADTDVLVIVLCTLRRDRLGFHGHGQPTSPFLDAMADRGVVFERNIAQAPWTRPSMAALFTGRYPRDLHLDTDVSWPRTPLRLPDTAVLLAEALGEQGYATVGAVGHARLQADMGFAQGFDRYADPSDAFAAHEAAPTSEVVVTAALALAADVPLDQRLYLRFNALDTHEPIRAPERYHAFFSGRLRLDRQPGWERRRAYDAAIRATDAQLARLVTELRSVRPNLLVVLAADHGEGLLSPAHHGRAHGNHLYRSAVETPLVLQHPALPPHRVGDLSMNIDVLPTVLDLLGAPVPAGIDGRSLAPVARGEVDETGHVHAFTETFFRDAHAESVVTRDWQLIRTYAGPGFVSARTDALFADLDADARWDVRAGFGDDARALGEALSTWSRAQTERAAATAPVRGRVDDATARRLEALGYAEPAGATSP